MPPSNPGRDKPPPAPFALPEWAPAGTINDQEWIANGIVSLPPDVWSPTEIHDIVGGWLLVEGFLGLGLSFRRRFIAAVR